MSIEKQLVGGYGRKVQTGAGTLSNGPYDSFKIDGGAAVVVTTTGPGDNYSSVSFSDGSWTPGPFDTIQFVSGTGILTAYPGHTSDDAV